jgi:DNA-binding transcriptional MocR family regulator
MPGRGDAAAFAQAALRHRVAIIPGHLLSASGQASTHLRLAFTSPPGVLTAAAATLARAYAAS